MKAAIFLNGEYGNTEFYKKQLQEEEYNYIVAVDGGGNFLKKIAILPNVAIGDFDSIENEVLTEYELRNIPIYGYSKEKNETDSELAIMHCIEKKCTEITIYGAIGTRFDHSFGNIYLLNLLLLHNIKGRIINENNIIYLVKNEIILDVKVNTTVSILSYTDLCEGITIKGFKYPVVNGKMEHIKPGYGISNIATVPQPQISVRKGILIVTVVLKE